jgi:tRNA (guanine-N7-)-methyltransferase
MVQSFKVRLIFQALQFDEGLSGIKGVQSNACFDGAGDGNRTHAIGLGSRSSTIELHPQIASYGIFFCSIRKTTNEVATLNNPIKRQLRSYIRRERKLTTQQQAKFAELWEKDGLSVDQGLLDYKQAFDRVAPCVLEVGFGKGASLLQMARNCPEFNYIGVEVHQPGVIALCKALANEDINNVKIFHADAITVLTHCIPDASLERIQIFFPDPWPKRRQQKRRLIQLEFVNLVVSKLKNNGVLHLATDCEDYAMHMLQITALCQRFCNPGGANNFTPRPDYRPLTKYEDRGGRLGHQIFDLVLIKSAQSFSQ